MNIFGAGLATSISAAAGFVLIFICFMLVDQKEYKTRSRHNFRWSIVRKLIGYGTPAGLQVMSDVGSFTLMLLEIGKLGNVALCASTIAFSINNLSFTPLMGISDATAIIKENVELFYNYSATINSVCEVTSNTLDEGGNIVATGTPEEIAKEKGSYTGQFLKKML